VTAARKRKSLVADEWGALSDEMRALPNAKWRGFVEHFLLQEPGYGAATAAARSAGFGKPNSSALTMAQIASRLLRDPRVVAALAAESKKLLRAGAPEATKALMALIRNPEHRDHGRAIGLVLARVDPEVAKHDFNVTHRVVDSDTEALEELRAVRALGAPREKLIELFGGNGLARLEKLEAADIVKRADAAKVVEGEVING
jgi:phage terminase small subunit